MKFTTLLAFVQTFMLDGDVKVRVFELIKTKSSHAFNGHYSQISFCSFCSRVYVLVNLLAESLRSFLD